MQPTAHFRASYFAPLRLLPAILCLAPFEGLRISELAAFEFGTLSGQLTGRAGIINRQATIDEYTPIGISATSFVGASIDVSQASASPELGEEGRTFLFAVTATSSTDTNATTTIPRAFATAALTQQFSLDAPARVILTATVRDPDTQEASVNLVVEQQGGLQSLTIDDTQGTELTQAALFAAGTHQFSLTISTRAFTAGTSHTGTAIGTLMITHPADSNGDLQVDALDLATWESAFGVAGPAALAGDFDGDLRATGRDLLLWQQQLGPVGASGTASLVAVPEPSSFLAGILCLAMGSKRLCGVRRHRQC